MNKKHLTIAGALVFGALTVGTAVYMKTSTTTTTSTTTGRGGPDDALLALIKNDQAGFETWVRNGGDLFAHLPMIDGKKMTVAEGLAYFERTGFIKHLQANKIPFVKQNKDGKDDVLFMAMQKNNPELFEALMKENPDLTATYGEKGWTLLHYAAAGCNHKLSAVLQKEKKLTYDLKAKDGSIPLNLAVQSDCIQMLSYWKEQGADFKTKDGRGTTALSLLAKKKDAAMTAFYQSFEPKSAPKTAFVEPKEINFYKKRVVPKDQKVDYSALIEPEDRPMDATETAEYSEFAD